MSQQFTNPGLVRVQLRGVLASSCFRDSERHRRLFEFLVESALAGRPVGRLVQALLDKAYESNDRAWAIKRLEARLPPSSGTA